MADPIYTEADFGKVLEFPNIAAFPEYGDRRIKMYIDCSTGQGYQYMPDAGARTYIPVGSPTAQYPRFCRDN